MEVSTANRLVRNVVANQAGFVVSAMVTFFLSPFVVNSLGATRYGVWSLIVSLTGNYGLLAFGLQGAMTRYMAHAAATGDRERVNGYLNTALWFLLRSAALAVVVGVLVALFMDRIFVLPRELAGDARWACLLVTLSAAATLVFAGYESVLVAHQRFQLTNAVGTVHTLLRAGMTVWMLRQGYGIVGLALLGAGLTLTNGLAVALLARRNYPWLHISSALVSRPYLKELVSYGYKSFTIGIAVALIFQCDLFVVGAYLTPDNITTYTLAGTLITYFTQFVSAIVNTLTPHLTALHSQGKGEEMREFFLRGSGYFFMLGGVIWSGCFWFGKPFYSLWVGAQYSKSADILAILAVAFVVDTGTRICTATLTAMARIGPLAVASLAEGVVNLCLSVVLVQKFGVVGVAIGTVIPSLIARGCWLQFHASGILSVGRISTLARGVLPGLLAAFASSLLAAQITDLVRPSNWWLFFADVGVYLSCIAVAVYLARKVQLGVFGCRLGESRG